MSDRDQRIERINEVLISIAEGNFQAKSTLSNRFDDIDAIASGVNMLSEELRDSVITRNYLDSVLKGIVDMLVIFNEHFIITSVNGKLCELLQKPAHYFIGQPLGFLFAKKAGGFVNQLKELVQHEEQVYNVETEFKLRQRTALPVMVSLSVLKSHRTTTGYLLIAKDLKQILLTSRALQQRNEELKTLLYKVSHDLQGPLASILGLFQVIEQQDHNLDTLQYYVDLIKRSTTKLEKTISGLSNLGIDEEVQQLATFDVKKTIEEVIDDLRKLPEGKAVAFKTSVVGKDAVSLVSEERLFRIIIQNILENSLKYRRTNIDHPWVEVVVRPHRRGVHIIIEDNGQGMSRHVQQQAFDMFYRGNPASQGSGLGLAIAKSNVEKLGGEISLKSKLQQGTETQIFLPSIDRFTFDNH